MYTHVSYLCVCVWGGAQVKWCRQQGESRGRPWRDGGDYKPRASLPPLPPPLFVASSSCLSLGTREIRMKWWTCLSLSDRNNRGGDGWGETEHSTSPLYFLSADQTSAQCPSAVHSKRASTLNPRISRIATREQFIQKWFQSSTVFLRCQAQHVLRPRLQNPFAVL